jgi:glycosyltransferase involved in cell wall biosynthesis
VRVLVVHNRYTFEGGEEAVVAGESALLRGAGVEVLNWERDSKGVADLPLHARAGTALGSLWNRAVAREFRGLVRAWQPDVVHVHNTQPLISAAVHHVAASEGVRTIQSIHNYRLFCVNGLALRNATECTICLGRAPWAGVAYRCYRNSVGASLAAAGAIVLHRRLGTWTNRVSLFSVPSTFTAGILAQAGVPTRRIVYRPQVLVQDPGVGGHDGRYLLFVGRLSDEKGIGVLIDDAFIDRLPLPLHICGDGPLVERVRECSRKSGRVVFHGRIEREGVIGLMKRATLLLMPSRVYEVAPLTLIEALATGLPSLVADRGAMPEHVEPHAGWKVKGDDPESWFSAIDLALSDPDELRLRGTSARSTFLAKHAPEVGLRALVELYDQARQAQQGGTGSA